MLWEQASDQRWTVARDRNYSVCANEQMAPLVFAVQMRSTLMAYLAVWAAECLRGGPVVARFDHGIL